MTEEERMGKMEERSEKEKEATKKGLKSCKGYLYLYFSPLLNSKPRNPICVGFTTSLQQQQVPGYTLQQSEIRLSKEGLSRTEFNYSCVGYSVYFDRLKSSADPQGKQVGLPICVGLEIFMGDRPSTADQSPAHVTNEEGVHVTNGKDGQVLPQPRPYKAPHPIGEEFLSRFTRSASMVASGVYRNLHRVAKFIKDNFD